MIEIEKDSKKERKKIEKDKVRNREKQMKIKIDKNIDK